MKFLFGNRDSNSSHDYVIIEAHNLKHAIKIFKVSELFPEKYVDKSFIAKKTNGYLDQEHNYDLDRYVSKLKAGAKIFVYEEKEVTKKSQNKYKKIHELTVEECINVDFRDILPQQNLLEAPQIVPNKESESKELLPVIESSQAVTQVFSKQILRQKHDEILLKRAELKEMVSALNQSMDVLHKELQQKAKVIYVIETFMGIHEEIVQINNGQTASEDEPLTLFQQRLYMDEEVGLWGEYEDKAQGLDFTQIEEFDKWIATQYKRYLYAPKSICVFRVRRSDKDYGDRWANVQCNAENKRTYFLIRNGENLYRIWSDVSVGQRLFPTKNEYADVLKEKDSWNSEERKQELLKGIHESYLYGLIAIQGVLERTDALGTSLRASVNLMKTDGTPESKVKFVRDDEPEFWLGDGRPRWEDYVKANRESIKTGTRVVLATRSYYFHLSQKEGDDWRCAPFRPSHPPSRGQIYTIESDDNKGYTYSAELKFMYAPGDEIWSRETYESHPRKKRVPWLVYRSEVLNFDEITFEEAEYYEQNRLDRHRYIDILPTIHWIKRLKKEEQKLELEFTKFIAGQLGWDESRYGEISEAIKWWKLKNMWKRAVTINEALAVRMILKKLKKES